MPYFYIVVTAVGRRITAARHPRSAARRSCRRPIHRAAYRPSPHHLPENLTRAGPLPVAHGRDGQVFQRGRVYVAPPDYHMVLGGT